MGQREDRFRQFWKLSPVRAALLSARVKLYDVLALCGTRVYLVDQRLDARCAVRNINNAQGDGAAVLALSVLDAHRNSKYCVHLVAVVHPDAVRMRPQLEAIGYEVRRAPLFVSMTQVEKLWPESSYFVRSGKRRERAACRV